MMLVLAGEYMALPASQYSVLDGAKVERLSDDTFRVYVGVISFFNFEVEPVLTLMVKPTDNGCIIEMLACKLRGSPLIESQNCKFSARMKNVGMLRIHFPDFTPVADFMYCHAGAHMPSHASAMPDTKGTHQL